MDVQALFVRDDKTSPSEALALLKFRLQALALYRGIASDVKSQESGSVKLRCRRFVPVVPISSAGQSLLVLGETAEGSSVTRAKPWLLLSPDQRPLQAEAFEDLLAKLKNLWAPRQTVFIEGSLFVSPVAESAPLFLGLVSLGPSAHRGVLLMSFGKTTPGQELLKGLTHQNYAQSPSSDADPLMNIPNDKENQPGRDWLTQEPVVSLLLRILQSERIV